MAQPTNTFDAYAAKGIREDLSDIVYRIDPTETCFTTNIGRGKATAKFHEWQVQTLAAAVDTNAQIEGDDATANAAVPTSRVGNRTQIAAKTVHQAVFTAGGKPSMLFMHPVQKTVFSAFAGIAVNRINQSSSTKDQVTIIGGADTYVGDFGNLTAVVSIFMRNRVAILVDPKMAKMASLRPMKNWELAKTGDSLKRQILQEYTLEVSNEAA